MPQTTVLLGAGASVDAKLPISSALTEKIAKAVQEDRTLAHLGIAAALNQAIGAMIAHDTRRGASPYAGLDVERLFSAIKMLSEKDDLEIAPFVGDWNDSKAAVSGLPLSWPKRFYDEIEGTRKNRIGAGLGSVFTDGVRALTKADTDGDVYKQLMVAMLQKLKAILGGHEPGAFAYLAPLFALPMPICIATLNYDAGVELAASQAGVNLDTGVGTWDGGLDWTWGEEKCARLLKLHGSLDWTLTRPPRVDEERHVAGNPRKLVEIDAGRRSWYDHERPGIVFGAREKLQAEGPFLAMLHEFSRWMRDTDRLIVVGYSFRDDHINVLLRDWLDSDSPRTLTIVDPSFPPGLRTAQEIAFAQRLANRVNNEAVSGQEHADGSGGGRTPRGKYTILRQPAAAALARACAPSSDVS